MNRGGREENTGRGYEERRNTGAREEGGRDEERMKRGRRIKEERRKPGRREVKARNGVCLLYTSPSPRDS